MSDAEQTAESAAAAFAPGASGADPAATRLVRELKHDRGILSCRCHPAGQYLFAGARDNFVHRWDLSAEPVVDAEENPRTPPIPYAPAESRLALPGHESWVRAMALFPDGERLVTGDYVGRVIVWPALAEQPEPLLSFEAHEGSVRAVSVSPDGGLIATAGNDRMVRVWRADGAEQPYLDFSGHDCHVYNVAFHPGGKTLVSADLKGVVRCWDVETGENVRDLDATSLHTYSEKYTVNVGGIRGMTFSPDGSVLACTGSIGEDKGIAQPGNARVLLFDWESGSLMRELRPLENEAGIAWGVRFHPDGFLVGTGGSRTGGYLWFWTPESETSFHIHKFATAPRGPGFDIDIAPDNRTLAVANPDGTLRLFDMVPEQVDEA